MDETHKGNRERNIAVLSQELMAGGYKRQIVRADGAAATVSPVRLAILATMADGSCEPIQGLSPGNGLGEGAVKEVKAMVRTLRFESHSA